ncbi:hypothetical protein SNE40_010872 [Patella caerulea]|uniref:SH3 domain-containing protein n=2 Tax=Patella caerulea TaxID=87958 RepID=A0AAN8JR75_PATCE
MAGNQFEYRMYSEEEDWDLRTLQILNKELENYLKMLPGGMDLTLNELQEMAAKQQQQIESQQQVLVAKEQRLKYLKQQEYKHQQLSTEHDRLRRLRDKVEAQEMKLKKLRALQGQVDQQNNKTAAANSELDSVKAMFNEKEKELTLAVAKVEQLTRQLEDLKHAKLHGINGETRNAAAAELEKLKKELLMRNQMYQQQNNKLAAKRELLQKKKDDTAKMDNRIHELQQRLKKRKSQLAANRNNSNQNKKPSSSNIAAVEPYIQHPTKDVTKDDLYSNTGFIKHDPKYKSLPQNSKFLSEKPKLEDIDIKMKDDGKEMNNNVQNKIDSRISEWNKKISNGTVPSSFPAPRLVSYRVPQQNPPSSQSQPNAQNVPRTSIVSNIANLTPKPFGSSSGVVNRVTGPVQQPVISITEEERQAGSGQSSPASSDSAQTSPNGTTANQSTKSSQPLPTRSRVSQSSTGTTVTRPGTRPPPPPVPIRTTTLKQDPGPAVKSKNVQPTAIRQDPPKQPNHDVVDSAKVIFDSPAPGPGQPQATSTPIGNNESSKTQPGSPNSGQKPTYRYAPKSVIANTYMSRLGGAAFEKYQKNMNLLYNPKDSSPEQEKNDPSTKTDGNTEEKTSFAQRIPVMPSSGPVKANHSHFGMISSPQHTNITSDKVSYKLNTPKHIRRRHSDSDNEEVTKMLIRVKEKNNSLDNSKAESSDNSNNSKNESQENNKSAKDTTNINKNKTDKSKVLKRVRSNLKGNNPNKSKNRVSFDPLALLLDASLEGELELVKRTASQVTDVSAPNDEGITALHNAICAGHYEIVKFLLEFGCDVNSPDSDGWTPLHCAASCNNLPMVKLLVEHGACIFATTISDQETAAEKCEEDEDGYDGCSDYLYSVQEKLGIMHNGEVWAVFDYEATNSDELNFKMWDKLIILRKGDEKEKEWWWARLNNKEGYVARNLLGLYPRVRPKTP